MERLNATERRTATGNWLLGYQSLRVACLSMPPLSSMYRDDGIGGGVADDEGEGGKR